MSIEDRIKKLPKWAQSYIRLLEHNMESCEKRIIEVSRGSKSQSNISVNYGRDEFYLLGTSRIRFKLSDGTEIQVTHDRYEDGIQLMAVGGRIKMKPRVSNVIFVGTEK